MPAQPRKTETKLGRNTATSRRKAVDEEPPQKPARRTTSKKADPTPRRPRTTRQAPAQAAAAPSPVAAPQPEGDDKYAPTAWGNIGGSGGVDLELPSGQLALVRRPGLQQLIVEGVLHRMDNLTALVESKHVKKGAKGKPDEINIGSVIQDNEALADVLHTVDRVVCAVVLKPHVEMAPNDVTRRQQGVIYADSVDIQDKMFIFNWALGGTRDLESFRRESEAVVGGLQVSEGVEHSAE